MNESTTGAAPRGPDRRRDVAHPGPMLVRQYLEPLGLSPADVARHVGMDAAVLAAMLAGDASIDVDTAIRVGRALQINPRRLMAEMNDHDFAIRRANAVLQAIGVMPDDGRLPFPETGFLRGVLTGLRESWGYEDVRFETLAFVERAQRAEADLRSFIHPIEQGSLLRVFDRDDAILWSGPVLQTLDGKPFLPYVRPSIWIDWFTDRYAAEYVPVASAAHRPPLGR